MAACELRPFEFPFTSVFLFSLPFQFQIYFLFAFPSSTLGFLFHFSYNGYTRSSKLVAFFYLRLFFVICLLISYLRFRFFSSFVFFCLFVFFIYVCVCVCVVFVICDFISLYLSFLFCLRLSLLGHRRRHPCFGLLTLVKISYPITSVCIKGLGLFR